MGVCAAAAIANKVINLLTDPELGPVAAVGAVIAGVPARRPGRAGRGSASWRRHTLPGGCGGATHQRLTIGTVTQVALVGACLIVIATTVTVPITNGYEKNETAGPIAATIAAHLPATGNRLPVAVRTPERGVPSTSKVGIPSSNPPSRRVNRHERRKLRSIDSFDRVPSTKRASNHSPSPPSAAPSSSGAGAIR